LTLAITFENSKIHWDFNSQSESSLKNVRVHSLTLFHTPKSMKCDSQASLLARTFASLCIGHEHNNLYDCWAIFIFLWNWSILVLTWCYENLIGFLIYIIFGLVRIDQSIKILNIAKLTRFSYMVILSYIIIIKFHI